MKKILLASNQPIISYGLSIFLKSEYSELDLQTCVNFVQTTEMLKTGNFDLVIINLDSENDMTADILKIKSYPSPILVFSSNSSFSYAQKLYQCCIQGFLDTKSEPEEILLAVKQVLGKETYMSEAFKRYLLESHILGETVKLPKLTKRESEVALLMLKGKKMSEIGESLNLKASTITTFKTKIYEKLGIKNLLELEQAAKSHSLILN
jgi:DNA-binding NarL/FixJ family response regulator